MSWQVARKRPGRKVKQERVYVSLNKRGEIAMNEQAFRAIGQPASVTLLYDTDARLLGVKYPVAIDRHFFTARRYGRGRKMRIVRAARLLKQIGITVGRTLVFENVSVEAFKPGEPMLVLDLNHTRFARQNSDQAAFAAAARFKAGV